MEIVYLLVVLGIATAVVVVWAFFWAIRSGQFDDLEGPAYRAIMEKDEPVKNNSSGSAQARRK